MTDGPQIQVTEDEPHLVVGEPARGEPMPDSLAEVDPVMQRFQEAPYDPVASAWGGGRLVGLGAMVTSFHGVMRPLGYVLGIALLSNWLFLVHLMIVSYPDIRQLNEGAIGLLPSALLYLLLGTAGFIMLIRLVGTASTTASYAAYSDDRELS